MTRSYGWISGACFAGLGLGYLAGTQRASSTGFGEDGKSTAYPPPFRTMSHERLSRSRSEDELLFGVLQGRSVQDLSDDDLVDAILRLSKYDPTQNAVSRSRQGYQLQLLLSKLPASRLEQAAEAFATHPGNWRNVGGISILAVFAAKHPQRAVAWAKDQKNANSVLANVIGTIAETDPMAAAEIYREGLLEGKFGRNSGWQASYGLGNAMARLGVKPLLAFIDSLPLQQQGSIISNCHREVPENERLELMEEVHRRSKNGHPEYDMNTVFYSAVTTDPFLAEACLTKMNPGKDRAMMMLSGATPLLHSGNTDGARTWMTRAIAEAAGSEKELIAAATSQMAYSNPAHLAIFTSLLPEGVDLTAEDLKSQAANSIHHGFNGLAGLASAIRDPAERTKLITETLGALTKPENPRSVRMNALDFEIVSRQLRSLQLTGEHAQEIEAALEAVKNILPGSREQ